MMCIRALLTSIICKKMKNQFVEHPSKISGEMLKTYLKKKNKRMKETFHSSNPPIPPLQREGGGGGD